MDSFAQRSVIVIDGREAYQIKRRAVWLCDAGSVRFVPQTIDINIWRAMSTTRGGETVTSQ